jgi:uncharacterized protein YjbI with pentapeptide repeats
VKAADIVAQLIERRAAGDTRFDNAGLAQLDLHGTDLGGTCFAGAMLRGTRLDSCDLHEADLRGADLDGASMQAAFLVRADLSEACLRGADLRGANLRKARFAGADLRGADLRGTTLESASITLGDGRFEGAALDATHAALVLRTFADVRWDSVVAEIWREALARVEAHAALMKAGEAREGEVE